MNLSAKIELLIQAKKLSASQFADTLGIPRSSISHILSGRNKPSLDVVQKILLAFPEIPAEELLDDKRDLSIVVSAPKVKASPITITPSLFDAVTPSAPESTENNLAEQTIVQSNLRKPKENGLAERTSVDPAPISPSIQSTYLEKKIERVLIFYTDGTFSESKPQN
jgi:transcriptional regulator with XRE-family HTH domain